MYKRTTVQRALGHRQITTTEVYARVSDERLKRAIGIARSFSCTLCCNASSRSCGAPSPLSPCAYVLTSDGCRARRLTGVSS